MYQIYESKLYFQQFILEAKQKIKDDSIIPDETTLNNTTPDDTTPDNTTPDDTTPDESSLDENPPNSDGDDSSNLDEDQPVDSTITNFNAIQKFILYNKLRELQYKLDSLFIINTYKDKDSLIQFNKFLSYVITFFSIFDYKQASKLTERLLVEFKKIK